MEVPVRVCALVCMCVCPAGPPEPSESVRVNERAARVTQSTIFFKFNCSWFSDVNGAVRLFTIVIAESDGRVNTPTLITNTVPLYCRHY